MREAYGAGSSKCETHAVSNKGWRVVVSGFRDTIEQRLVDGLARACRSNKNRKLRCSVPDDDLDLSGPFLTVDEPSSLTA